MLTGKQRRDWAAEDVPAGAGSETNFGINVGAGFDFMVGSAELFMEARLHNVFTDGPDTRFIPITLGLRFWRIHGC